MPNVNRPSAPLLETVWAALSAAITTWSLLGVALAQAGLYRVELVTLSALVGIVVGWGFVRWKASAIGFQEGENHRAGGAGGILMAHRDAIIVVLIAVLGTVLFFWPAEHLVQLGDSSIYPNTAAGLLRTGGLEFPYNALRGLSDEQKRLFYVPADEQLPDVRLQSYHGLVYGAYYMLDPVGDTLVSSRPPLLTVWMAAFALLFGTTGMGYVVPLFGVMGLVTIYWIGRHTFGRWSGLLAGLWLAFSFPQLHFSRTSYAEVMGQFFVWTFLYGLIAYVGTGWRPWILLGVAAWTAAFAARIDALLALPALAVFVLILVRRRDKGALALAAVAIATALGLTFWTVNWPYLGATTEILLGGWPADLQTLPLAAGLGGGLGVFLGIGGLAWIWPRIPWSKWAPILRGIVVVGAVLGLAYSLYVRPLFPEYILLNEEPFATHSEELVAMAARYISPLMLWLAVAGIVTIFLQDEIPLRQTLFLAVVIPFVLAFFSKYTTASVYPVALRRWVPEVFPGLCLLAAYAVQGISGRRQWQFVAWIMAAAASVWLLSTSVPYWSYREAQGTTALVDELAARLPADGVVLFEPVQGEAVVGWFAAPLWSLHRREALLINAGPIDAQGLHSALEYWERMKRPVYLVVQHDPATWWPTAFCGTREHELVWDSSIIGQSRQFPPYVWRFRFTFSIYRWLAEDIYCEERAE